MFKPSSVVSLLTVSALAAFPSVNEIGFDRETANWKNVLKTGDVFRFRDLEHRQICIDVGYTLCPGGDSCCPTGGVCCADGGNNVVVGCCIAGNTCIYHDIQFLCAPNGDITILPPIAPTPPPPPESPSAPINLTTTTITPSTIPPSQTTIPLQSTFSPFTAGATSFATTLSGNPQPTGTPGGLGVLSQLYQCAPCGGNTCSFSADPGSNVSTFSLIVGTPIQNCEGNATIQSTIQGSITLVDTWSVTGDIGLNVGNLKLEANANWGQTEQTTWSQSGQISVEPGQVGAMVVNILYRQTNGTMNFGDGISSPLLSNQPLEVISYGSEIIPCGTAFPANESVSFNCKSAAPIWLKGAPLSTTSFIPMAVVVFLLVSL